MAILEGSEDLTTWTDQELLAGRRRNKKGNMAGGRPKVVPMAILQELTRRRFAVAEDVVRENLPAAIKLWAQIMNDPLMTWSLRLEASKLLVERAWGKPRERHQVDVKMSAPWEEALKGVAIKLVGGPQESQAPQPDDIIDAEVVEDDVPAPQPSEAWQKHHGRWSAEDAAEATGAADDYEWDDDDEDDPTL